MEYWPVYLWCYIAFTVIVGYLAYREDFIIDLQGADSIFMFLCELFWGLFLLFSSLSFWGAMLDEEFWEKIKKYLF